MGSCCVVDIRGASRLCSRASGGHIRVIPGLHEEEVQVYCQAELDTKPPKIYYQTSWSICGGPVCSLFACAAFLGAGQCYCAWVLASKWHATT